MRAFLRRIAAVLLVLVVAGRAMAATYYVDPVNGNDANAGTSAATAVATLAHGISLTTAALDSVVVCNTGTCTVSAGITWPGFPIAVLGANASGAIDGSVAAVNFTGSGDLFTFSATYTTNSWSNAVNNLKFTGNNSGAFLNGSTFTQNLDGINCEFSGFTSLFSSSGGNIAGWLNGCKLHDCGKYSVVTSNRTVPTLTGCLVHDLTTGFANGDNNFSLIGNVFYNIAGGTIVVSRYISAEITGNTFDNVTLSLGSTGIASINDNAWINTGIIISFPAGSTAQLLLDFNDYYGATTILSNAPSGPTYATGSHDITSDPKFTNASTHNYTPTSSSPLIGAGMNGSTIGALGASSSGGSSVRQPAVRTSGF